MAGSPPQGRRAAQPCRGFTQAGVRCRRSTSDPSGWCGQCTGTVHPDARTSARGPGAPRVADVDPLAADTAPHWEPDSFPAGRMLALDRSTDPEVLGALARSLDFPTRLRVALNPAAPGWVLGLLVGDRVSEVRVVVAANPSVEPASLAVLANDPDSEVAAAARANPGFNGSVAAHAGLFAD